MRTRLPLIAVTVALVTSNLVSLGRHGLGLSRYRIDLDVYRIGSLTWLHGGNLYGALPKTSAERPRRPCDAMQIRSHLRLFATARI